MRQEVLRIDQDLHPNDDYEIVLDAWSLGPEGLVDVRMTWVDTANADARSPFGRGVRRHLELDYVRHDPRHWTVRMTSRAGTQALEIGLDPAGSAIADAKVRTANGTTIERCRVQRGQIVAKRLLGLPVGLARIAVSCTDEAGIAHDAEIVTE